MKLLYPRCSGLDVHKETIVACVRVMQGRRIKSEVRGFSTTTRGILELSDWLSISKCTHVAMEATGVFWKPVWHVLAPSFELILANPAHIKNVPGRKTDVKDAEWIADLLAHGLISASFVPPEPIQHLRDLTRTRKQVSREIVQHTQRIQRVLTEANVRITSVLSDTLGDTGRRILNALIAGETDSQSLAKLRDYRVHASEEKLAEALQGTVTDHHRFLLRQHLQIIEMLEGSLREFDSQIDEMISPFRERHIPLTPVAIWA